MDAARAVELVGWSDRTLLKYALGAALAKTIPDRAIYDAVFERFFRFEPFAAAHPQHVRIGQEAADDPAMARGGAPGAGGMDGSQALLQLLLSGDSAALARRMQAAAREIGLTDIWFFTQKGYYVQNLQHAMGLESLELDIAVEGESLGSERARQLERARQRLLAEARTYVERALALYGTTPTR